MSTAPLRTLLLTCLGPLGALLLAEAAMRLHPSYLPIAASLQEREPITADARRLLGAREGFDVVIVGSSVAATNVRTHKLEEGLSFLDLDFTNLGTWGAPAVSTAMSLPAVLRGAPMVVVWVLAPGDLRREVRPDAVAAYDPFVASQLFDVAHLWHEPSFHAWGTLGWASLPIRHGAWLRAVVLDPLHEQRRIARRERRGRHERQLQEDLSELEAFREASAPDPDGPNGAGLRYVVQTLRARGIPLVVVPAPQHPNADTATAQLLANEILDGLVRDEGLDVVDISSINFVASDFRDPIHLGEQGRRRLELTLVDHLRRMFSEVHRGHR